MGCNVTKCSTCPKKTKACQLVRTADGKRVCKECYKKQQN